MLGGGGGSVALEGFVLLPAGIVLCNLILYYVTCVRWST